MPPSAPVTTLRVALLGCGTVGTQVARLIGERADDLAARIGVPLELVGIAVRSLQAERDPSIDPALLTTDARALVDRADIVIELMGGIEPARELIRRAISNGSAVVTANKALLAEDGPALYVAAAAAGVDLYFEAAVAGAVPVVRALRESLAGDQVHRVLGIVNGTTNYVLDQMATEGLDLESAVKEAQRLGYAEADPTADVAGYDAAAKAAILASLAFHTRVPLDAVGREGIGALTADDVAWAGRTGHVLKMLAVAERTRDESTGVEGILVGVHPALVPEHHPLARVDGSFNAVFVEAKAAGELMFLGRGAGGTPTSSAVVGDLVSVARHRVRGGLGPTESIYAGLPVLPADAARAQFQVRMDVADRPGVLAQVAAVFAEHGVSIEAVRQAPAAETAHLVVTSHVTSQRAVHATVEALARLTVVHRVVSVLRVEGA